MSLSSPTPSLDALFVNINKAKAIAKRNYKKYKECETRLNEALEYMDLNGNILLI